MKFNLFFILLILLPVASFAGDPPPLHFTGVPQVDLFSIRDMKIPTTIRDSSPTFTSMTERPSEKSPWIAGGLSLLLPGAGEVYAGNNLKGAIFFGIELGSWLTAYLYNKKGDDQTALFEDYADRQWSPVRYALWTYNNSAMLNNDVVREEFDLFYGVDPESVQVPGSPPFPGVNWEVLHAFEDAIRTGEFNGYTHLLPYHGEQQYYELIGKYEQFYSGWDDATINVRPDINFTVPEDSKYKIYSRMRAKANDYYDVASAMVSVAVINHVISAIDAAWTATRFNSSLHAQVDVKLKRTPYGIVPVKEARLSFTF